MQSVSVKAYGKVNLTLDIVGAKDGYHMLDTICCTINKYDKVTVRKKREDNVLVTLHGPYGTDSFIQSELNAYKAAVKFKEKYNTCGVNVEIIRNIQNGSGLGGSSADIAGVLNAMCKLFGVEESQKDIADSIGSDAGYLLNGGFARLRGRGEDVKPINSDWRLYFVIIYANKGVNTRDSFALYDQLNKEYSISNNDEIERFCLEKNIELFRGREKNDLLEPSSMINSEIRDNIQALKELSPDFVSMSGSGSSVYAMYDSYEMASWVHSKLREKYGYNVEIVSSYNPSRGPLVGRLSSLFSINH